MFVIYLLFVLVGQFILLFKCLISSCAITAYSQIWDLNEIVFECELFDCDLLSSVDFTINSMDAAIRNGMNRASVSSIGGSRAQAREPTLMTTTLRAACS